MAIQHEDIADPYIHEPKGAAAASARQVYVADGAGSGVWQKLAIQSLDGVAANGTLYDAVMANGSGGFTVANSHAQGSVYFFNTGTPYSWSYSGSFTKLAPTTTGSGIPVEFTEAVTARLTYTGTPTRKGLFQGKLSVKQATGSGKDLEFALYKNGVAIPGSLGVLTSISGSYHQIIILGYTSLATNDYVELYMRNTGGSGDVDVAAFQLSAGATL